MGECPKMTTIFSAFPPRPTMTVAVWPADFRGPAKVNAMYLVKKEFQNIVKLIFCFYIQIYNALCDESHKSMYQIMLLFTYHTLVIH